MSSSYDMFLQEIENEAETDTMDYVTSIRCTPMSDIDVRRLKGETVQIEEIRDYSEKHKTLKKEVRIEMCWGCSIE